MAVLLLTNTAGDICTTLGNAGSGTTASGYDINDLISGARSSFVRTTAALTGNRFGYEAAVDRSVTHMVIARADWLLTQQGMRVRPYQRSSGGTWSTIAGVDYNPLTSASLLGPYAQDLAFAISPSNLRGFAIEGLTAGGTAEAIQISKLYVSNAFDFGVNPDLSSAPRWEKFSEGSSLSLFTPIKGFDAYEVEAKITLSWFGVTTAKITAFKALAHILDWPLFLFDENSDIWSWKLEHVLVEDYSIEAIANDINRISISFLRLKHYE